MTEKNTDKLYTIIAYVFLISFLIVTLPISILIVICDQIAKQICGLHIYITTKYYEYRSKKRIN